MELETFCTCMMCVYIYNIYVDTYIHAHMNTYTPCLQVIRQLKSLVDSIHAEATMLVVDFDKFASFGKLPRSSDRITRDVRGAPGDVKVVFISHRWLRPWHTREECEANGHIWAGTAHPDDDAGSKHSLICAGVRKLALKKGWDLGKVCLWLDYCGVEQDIPRLLLAGVASLRGYISVCDAVLIPSPEVPAEETARTVDKIAGEYGERAWTRLESMSFYTVSIMIDMRGTFKEGSELLFVLSKGCRPSAPKDNHAKYAALCFDNNTVYIHEVMNVY